MNSVSYFVVQRFRTHKQQLKQLSCLAARQTRLSWELGASFSLFQHHNPTFVLLLILGAIYYVEMVAFMQTPVRLALRHNQQPPPNYLMCSDWNGGAHHSKLFLSRRMQICTWPDGKPQLCRPAESARWLYLLFLCDICAHAVGFPAPKRERR